MYNIIYHNNTPLKKDIKLLTKDKNNALLVKKTLESFAVNPQYFTWDIKKLEPKKHNRFRLRTGKYRIIFTIDYGNQILIIERISHRKNVYR